MNKKTYCGYIAIIGRPNVGKSTLLNALLGEKISITSRKPQTTRHKILGIKTYAYHQIIFVDTPGLHPNPKHEINKLMIKTALSALQDIDAIVFVVDAYQWTATDEYILKKIAAKQKPLIIALNKVDKIKDKKNLLPIMSDIQKKIEQYQFNIVAMVPISALKDSGLQDILQLVEKHLPQSPFLFPEDQITDRSERFITAEIIREKLMRLLGQEVPHAVTVEIEKFKIEKKILHIHAVIWVEREGQKKIVIGSKGEGLKKIGTLARKELEEIFGKRIFLQLWVKVKSGWTNDIRALQSLGYRNES